MRMISKIGQWFDHRLQLAAPIREAAGHPVPRNASSWFYVFGSAALTIFLLQLVTGILLALIYVPSAGEAWSSLQALNHQVALGWFIRAMHGWGSNFMVAIVLIHMVQVFLFGAHKFPRELTWVIGVFLLLMTLGMAFSGQVLRFDQDAFWGLGIGASIASRVPIIGPFAVKLMLGGPIIAGATLSRFFALRRSFPMRYGKTCSLPGSSFLRSPHALSISALLGLQGSLTRPSSKLLPSRITFSCGCMPCFHFFLQRLRHRSFSSARL
jgi:ubiquinol-cytochrome c reductase cytochrome b subunit